MHSDFNMDDQIQARNAPGTRFALEEVRNHLHIGFYNDIGITRDLKHSPGVEMMKGRTSLTIVGILAALMLFITGCYTQLAPPVQDEERVVVVEEERAPDEPEVIYEEEGEDVDVTNIYIYGGYPVYYRYYGWDPIFWDAFWYDPFYDPFLDPFWHVRHYYRPWYSGLYVGFGFVFPCPDPFAWCGTPWGWYRSRYYYSGVFFGSYWGGYYGNPWWYGGYYYPPAVVKEMKKRPFGRRGQGRRTAVSDAPDLAKGAVAGRGTTVGRSRTSGISDAAAKGRRTRKSPSEIARRETVRAKATRTGNTTRRTKVVRRKKKDESRFVRGTRTTSISKSSKASKTRRVLRRTKTTRTSRATVSRARSHSTSKSTTRRTRRYRPSSSHGSRPAATVSRGSSSSGSKSSGSKSSGSSSRRKRK